MVRSRKSASSATRRGYSWPVPSERADLLHRVLSDAVPGEKINELGSADESQWLSGGELLRARPELRRGDQDSLRGSFVQHRAVKVAYRGGRNCAAIPLDLDDQLPATDRIRVHGPDIDTTVARTLGGHDLHPHSLEERRHEVFEIDRVQGQEI